MLLNKSGVHVKRLKAMKAISYTVFIHLRIATQFQLAARRACRMRRTHETHLTLQTQQTQLFLLAN